MSDDEFALSDVEVSLQPMERFEEFLQSRGKRITKQRRILVDHVFRRHDHFDADELLDELQQSSQGKQASRATVYRALTELVDAGLLRKMDLAGRAVYEHDYGYPQHDHLYCTHCHTLIEFHSEGIEKLRDEVAQGHQFRVTGHKFIVQGICEPCQRAHRRPMRPLDLV